MRQSIKSELVMMGICLIVIPVMLLFGGEWAELCYMKHFSSRKYSYLDQGTTESGKHCFTVTDRTDPKFIKILSLTTSQEKFLAPKE